MKDTGCKKGMVVKCMSELREIGLIKTVKQGQGRPDIIYVKSFEITKDTTKQK